MPRLVLYSALELRYKRPDSANPAGSSGSRASKAAKRDLGRWPASLLGIPMKTQ